MAATASAVLTLAVLPASAQTGDPQAPRRAPYVHLYTRVGITGDSDVRIRQAGLDTDLLFEQVSWEHKSLSTQWTRDSIPDTGVRGGFFFRDPRWLSLSVEVLHFKIFAEEEKSVRVRGTDEGRPVDTVAPMAQFVQ